MKLRKQAEAPRRPQQILMATTSDLQRRTVALFEPLARWGVAAQLPAQTVWPRQADRMDVLMALTALRLECVRVEDTLRAHGPRRWTALKKVPLPKRLETVGLFGTEPSHKTLTACFVELERILAALEPLVLEVTRKPPEAGKPDDDFRLDSLRRRA